MVDNGEYCGLSTAFEVFLIFSIQLFFSVYFLFALCSDEPEVFLPDYSQPAILHAAHFRRVVKGYDIRYDIRVILISC